MNPPTSPPWQPDAMIRLVNRKAGLRHPAFGAHSGVTDRNQLQHDRILAVMAEPRATASIRAICTAGSRSGARR